jgi:PAS domain S-box-containing protein
MTPWTPIPDDLRTVFDASHNGIVMIGGDGRILVYNQAATRVLQNGGPPPLGRLFAEVHPETWPDMKQILESGRPQIGKQIRLNQATIIANRNPITTDGRVIGVISIFQDISEYEAIISELQGYRRLHRQFEAIFESSADGLYVTDGQATTVRVNSAYERITGLSRDELVGRNMAELVRAGVFDVSVSLEVLRQGGPVTIMQTVKSGKQVMVTGTPIYDESGEVVLVVTSVRDITELNELKARLEEARRLSSRYYQALLEQDSLEHVFNKMVVKSTAMQRVVQRAVKAAGAETSILISGESGVGKSMLARIIHQVSSRRRGPFVKISCGAIPETLLESELLGYNKGAFTGAAPGGKAGLIETAHTGTVFLDEVAELTPAMQVKLLQVIEDKTFTRVGATRPISVDVRIIAATNRDLKDLMGRGDFRQDLYYRLGVVPIAIPPLRERREDIPALILGVLDKHRRATGQTKRLEPEVVDRLMGYDYPGNVRELINIVEVMAIMSEGPSIGLADAPGEIRQSLPGAGDPLLAGLTLKAAVQAFEVRLVKQALNRHGTVHRAAEALGVHPTTLWRKLARR